MAGEYIQRVGDLKSLSPPSHTPLLSLAVFLSLIIYSKPDFTRELSLQRNPTME